MLDTKKVKSRNFQVLFLRNDPSQEVEVHEVGQVDYFTVQQRLEQGESVFITSQESQKIGIAKMKTRLVRVFKFDNH